MYVNFNLNEGLFLKDSCYYGYNTVWLCIRVYSIIILTSVNVLASDSIEVVESPRSLWGCLISYGVQSSVEDASKQAPPWVFCVTNRKFVWFLHEIMENGRGNGQAISNSPPFMLAHYLTDSSFTSIVFVVLEIVEHSPWMYRFDRQRSLPPRRLWVVYQFLFRSLAKVCV